MIRGSSLRWRLAAWVIGAMALGWAVVFVIVYQQTGSQLRSQVDSDVRGDIAQLSQAARTLPPSGQLVARLSGYVRALPPSGGSSLLFAVVPGHPTISNHPELFGDAAPDDGETAAQQRLENALARALVRAPIGLRTLPVPDLGRVRLAQEIIAARGVRIRVGAGEGLQSVTRAQRSVARSFLVAGGVALVLVVLAASVAGASLSRPLRRMARVASRVDDGDLAPRMATPSAASREVRVLADAFNHMLDRLAAAFAQQREFVADASHELRTPLTVIAGQLEVLAATARPTPEEVRRVQRLVAEEVARTSRLVDDMLLLARSEQRDFLRSADVELPGFVADLWSTTTAGAQRALELGPVPALTLRADPDRLAQALRNLIDNAVAHTAAPDGRVRLDVEALPGWVRFVVSDDGPGIPVDQRERIFERFHRTDDARDRIAGGAGLGLAIVQAIARAHRGDVRAAQPRGPGARLELDVPDRAAGRVYIDGGAAAVLHAEDPVEPRPVAAGGDRRGL